jgi:hypothetical protein
MTNSDRFKIPRFYKTLLALTVVIGPITWLMLTEDGRRRTDLMILGFKGEHMVEMRLDTLAAAATEAQVRQFLPQVKWQCHEGRNAFGDLSCVSPIGAFNDTPAHYLVMYYEAQALQAMKVVYRGGYHGHLTGLLRRMLGPGENLDGILQWVTDRGLVLVQAELSEDAAEPTLLWLSAEQAARRGPPGS